MLNKKYRSKEQADMENIALFWFDSLNIFQQCKLALKLMKKYYTNKEILKYGKPYKGFTIVRMIKRTENE